MIHLPDALSSIPGYRISNAVLKNGRRASLNVTVTLPIQTKRLDSNGIQA